MAELPGSSASVGRNRRLSHQEIESIFLCVLCASVLGGSLGSGRMDHAFARRLRIEQLVSFLGLFQFPVVREQLVDVDFAIGDVAGAVGLADGGEGP